MPEHISHTSPASKFLYPLSRLSNPFNPSLFIIHYPKRKYKKAAIFSHSLGFRKMGRAQKLEGNANGESSWCCMCKGSEEDMELDAEIMKFMEKSEKPSVFPSKAELIRGGRVDLVEAIRMRGGWYCLGWDEESVEEAVDFDLGEFQRRVEGAKESAFLREDEERDDSVFGCEMEDEIASGSGDLEPLDLASSSLSSLGLSLDSCAKEDSGVEGILSRLEKQRNIDLGIDLRKHEHETLATSKDDEHGRHFDTSYDVARADLGKNSRVMPGFHILNTTNGKISPNIEPETWRTWSDQRAGFRPTEFEAAEISFGKIHIESDRETDYDGIAVTTGVGNTTQEIDHNHVRTRLQQLESELNATLCSLRSNREESMTEEAVGSSSDYHKLSDTWEFQENEFMKAKEKLRSIRAKLAVLEGKMAMAIIDAQKIVDEKQKRIDGAHKALQLLRTTLVVWPNPASEVYLMGSFDGWTSQRKMEKSKTGIFSICLKLYPGRYEIKFIVDGIWKIDPLRPVVNNHGHENNLFIVT